MKILYFDCFSGISGDMTMGALLDAGGDAEALKRDLAKLGLGDAFHLHIHKMCIRDRSATASTPFPSSSRTR